ncbi:MAG: DUF3810 domain-containing protein [Lachnospiraceae bacterium]|nr:DUF3810 domain-containing protein [Lachnospiraceae bacterium]
MFHIKKDSENAETVDEKRPSEKPVLNKKRNWLLLTWIVGIAIYLSARYFPVIAEKVFARGVFKVYAWIMSHITGILPFSLAEFLLILFPFFILFVIILGIVNIIKKKGQRLQAFAGLIRDLLCITGIVFLWFMIGAGTNYYRYEFTAFSGLEVKKSDTEELYRLCMELAQKTNAARTEAVAEAENARKNNDAENAGKNATGAEQSSNNAAAPFRSALTNRERGLQAKLAMEKLSESYEVLKGYYPCPKPVLFSRVMSEFNITGVYFPWTVEANADVDIPHYSIGATMCHELSHLRGFMREDEANFISYLSCVNSDSAELRYSGYMLALVYAGNRLYSDSKELYYEVLATYSEGILADFRENNEYWKQFEDTALSEAGEKMNNTYLKANNQTDGTKSYGRMVDLLLAEYRKNHEE